MRYYLAQWAMAAIVALSVVSVIIHACKQFFDAIPRF